MKTPVHCLFSIAVLWSIPIAAGGALASEVRPAPMGDSLSTQVPVVAEDVGFEEVIFLSRNCLLEAAGLNFEEAEVMRE